MRPLVSYDDITLPYQPQPPQQSHSQSSRPPPSKKRKWSNQKTRQQHQRPHSHLSNVHPMENNINHNDNNPAPSTPVKSENDDLKDEESRELTYEEIWDDSALIDAWNAATEEYEAYNGPDKGWKTQPVHKSPVWYNVPSTSSKPISLPESSSHVTAQASPVSLFPTANGDDVPDDSQPLNFETFVPTHDPSLEFPSPLHPPSVSGPDYMSHYLPNPPGPMVSQDEAFTRALGAMYWGGYWTAVYHCQRSATQKRPVGEDTQQEAEAEGEEDTEEEEEVFVSTQR